MSRYQTTESSLAAIFGGKKSDWAYSLSIGDACGYPEALPGTAWTCELNILRAICEQLRPERLLEVGCYRGASLRAARDWVPGPRSHYAIDIDAGAAGHVPEGVRFLLGDGRQVDKLVPSGYEFDFCFLDGEHTKEGVLATLRALDRIAAERAVIVVHDQDPETCNGVRDRDGVQEFATKQEVKMHCPRCDAAWVVPWAGREPEHWICRCCGPQLAYERRPSPEVKWQWDELETPARLAILQRRW